MDFAKILDTVQRFFVNSTVMYGIPFFLTIAVTEIVKKVFPDRASFRWEIPLITVVIGILSVWFYRGGTLTREVALAGTVLGMLAAGMYRMFFARIRDIVRNWRQAKDDIDGKSGGAA